MSVIPTHFDGVEGAMEDGPGDCLRRAFVSVGEAAGVEGVPVAAPVRAAHGPPGPARPPSPAPALFALLVGAAVGRVVRRLVMILHTKHGPASVKIQSKGVGSLAKVSCRAELPSGAESWPQLGMRNSELHFFRCFGRQPN